MHILNLGGTHVVPELTNNCSLLSSIFNVEQPYINLKDGIELSFGTFFFFCGVVKACCALSFHKLAEAKI